MMDSASGQRQCLVPVTNRQRRGRRPPEAGRRLPARCPFRRRVPREEPPMHPRQITAPGECVADAFAESARTGKELALRVVPGGGPAVFVALSCPMAGPDPSRKDQQAPATTDEEVVRNLDPTH